MRPLLNSPTAQSALSPLRRTRCAIAAAGLLAALAAQAAPQAQGNLGRGLRELVALQAQQKADLTQPAAQAELQRRFTLGSHLQLDAAGRALVEVQLNGRLALANVRKAAERLGVAVGATAPHYHQGAFSAWLPVHQATALARLPGVRSVVLAMRAVTWSGRAQSQGVALLKSDAANSMGYTGAGITVAALSDSYDANDYALTHAAEDIRSGDLPGPRNPRGYLQPVAVQHDSGQGSDEGRAMLQIVHDVAPGARLCFATAKYTPIEFANSILALTDTDTGICNADIIVDDVIYLAEPMFQDGIIAQAVDTVAAKGVSYFSSAGNNPGSSGYAATFAPIADTTARADTTSVDLSLINPAYTVGGFHNFGATSSSTSIARSITVDRASTLIMQWNDPFDSDKVFTDYDLYLFSADGKSLVGISADDNPSTGQPIEGLNIYPGSYQLVLARSDVAGGTPSAPQLRTVLFGQQTFGSQISSDAPSIYGHAAAAGAISTGAVPFYSPTVPEPFTGTGPVTIYFDKDGNRLAKPVVRRKPEISAPDGGNTTFFYEDTPEDSDKQLNFFGTSASAPHAAGVAALLLQKAGGRAHLPPAEVKAILQASAGVHDLQPSFAKASAKAGKATVKVVATGDGSSVSGNNVAAFTVSMEAPEGYTLQSLSFDISTANAQRVWLGVPTPGLQFDPRGDTGLPLIFSAMSNLSYPDISPSPLSYAAPFSQQLTLNFAAGKFGPASTLSFGVDRDEVATGGGGASADLLAGGTISGTVLDAKGQARTFSAPFTTGKTGKGWSPLDGYGLIDAVSALQLVP